MANAMSPEQVRSFVNVDPRTGKLATVRADGQPHITPIWSVLTEAENAWGFDPIFNTGAAAVKGRNIRRDNRVMLSVDDERPPFTFVLVKGIAEVSDDLAARLPWATRIGGRSMGTKQAEAFGKRNAVAGELLIRLRPGQVLAQASVAE